MKSLIIICFGLLLQLTPSHAQSKLDPAGSKEAGLVSYLTSVKLFSEYYVMILSTSSTPESKDNAEYVAVRIAVDKLVNQLSVDLFQANKLNRYRKINNYVRGKRTTLPERFSYYQAMIADVDAAYNALATSAGTKSLSVEEILGIVERGQSIVESARDFREKKIQAITGLLKELKLSKIADLLEKTDEEKK